MGLLSEFKNIVGLAVETLSVAKKSNAIDEQGDFDALRTLCEKASAQAAAVLAKPANMLLGPAFAPLIDVSRLAQAKAGVVLAYLDKDFERALSIGGVLSASASPQLAFAGLNLSLDALGQVKTAMVSRSDIEGYEGMHGDQERQLIAAAHRAAQQASPFVEGKGAIRSSNPFLGLSMAAGYLDFLGGSEAQARSWIQRAAQASGVDAVAKRETREPSDFFWFYRQVDKEAMDQYRGLIRSTLDLPEPSARRLVP